MSRIRKVEVDNFASDLTPSNYEVRSGIAPVIELF